MSEYLKDAKDPALVGLYADTEERGPAIELLDGTRLHILDPEPEVITAEVLAHALSQLCRFTGHTREFYSVAQHCVMVSRIVPPELALQGLLHDASEAFIGDLSRPLKVALDHLAPGVVRGVEERIHEVIAQVFGSGYPHDPRVKVADNVALATEKRDVMAPAGEPWGNMPEPLPEAIRPLLPAAAKALWMRRYRQLAVE